jgi:PEGA domain
MSVHRVKPSLGTRVKRANDCETSMKSLHSVWLSRSSIAVLALFVLAATPAAGQVRQRDGGESTGSAAAPRTSPAPVASPAPPPSAPVATPATSSSSGSSDSGSSASEGRRRSDGGGRTDRGSGGSKAATAKPRDGGGRTAGTTRSGTGDTGESQGGHQSGATARRTRDGGEVVGTAVRRPSVPDGGGSVIIIPGGGYGFYPWGYGGLGFGGYYGGYYDPWYGGGGGGYSTYYSGQSTDDGALRLKVKPREASVYVDGYYAGVVDDFDGVFQRLHLSSGPHRIEIRQPDHDPLSFDVRIDPDQTVTYRGELTKTP